MSIVERLKKKKQKLKDQYQRGKEVTEQMKAERLRRKGKKMSSITPGTIRYGLANRQSPLDLMEDVKRRRKEKREEEKH